MERIAGDSPRAVYFELSSIPPEMRNDADLILLGRSGGTNFFTFEIESIEPPPGYSRQAVHA